MIENSDRIILNFFIPFSNGKFIASCLMFSPDVYKMLPTDMLFSRLSRTSTTWGQIEFNDLDFWWKPEAHNDPMWFMNWMDIPNWQDKLSDNAVSALTGDQYAFYTCHGLDILNRVTSKFPNAKILKIIPDLELTKRNHELKRPPDRSKHFPEYDPLDSFTVFNNADIQTPYTFTQSHIYDKELFTESITALAQKLSIKLDIDKVLEYRACYLNHPMNQI